MKLLYIDESGCPGSLPSSTSKIQPIFAIGGFILDSSNLKEITKDFISLKQTFFPGSCTTGKILDYILSEIKGSDIKNGFIATNRNKRRASFGFVDKTINLLKKYECNIIYRIWIKGINRYFNGRSVYTFSIQDISKTFQEYLNVKNDHGFIIADSRYKQANANVSHSIFTQKFRSNGDSFPNIIEMPVFGHSENHAGLQISDIICSSLISPISIQTYCQGHINSIHIRNYSSVKLRYKDTIKDLQFRYQNHTRKWCGGITVSDELSCKSTAEFFN